MPRSDEPSLERALAGVIVEARLFEVVFPEHANHYGTLWGGQVLALMDKAAYVVASRYARQMVVTAASERVDFHVPIQQGQLVEVIARLVATGTASMSVEVEMIAEDLRTGERQLATRGKFVMVALDEQGKPVAVPALAPRPS